MRTEIKRMLLKILYPIVLLIAEVFCIWRYHVSVRMSDDYKYMCALQAGKSIDGLVSSGKLVLSEENCGNMWVGTFFGYKMYVIVDEWRAIKGVVVVETGCGDIRGRY